MPKSPSIHRTPLYRAKAAYANMKRRCKGGVACEPSYATVELRMTLEEWLAWAVPRYEQFDREHPGERPSVSRFSDVGHYEIGNVEVLSMEENLRRKRPVRIFGPKSEAHKQSISRGIRAYHQRRRERITVLGF